MTLKVLSVTYCRGTKLGLVRASATRNSCLDSCGACFRNAKNGMHSTIWGQSTYDYLTWQSITKLPSRTLNLRAFPFNVLDKLLKPTLDLTSSIRTPRSCNSSPQQSPPNNLGQCRVHVLIHQNKGIIFNQLKGFSV